MWSRMVLGLALVAPARCRPKLAQESSSAASLAPASSLALRAPMKPVLPELGTWVALEMQAKSRAAAMAETEAMPIHPAAPAESPAPRVRGAPPWMKRVAERRAAVVRQAPGLRQALARPV